MTFAEDVQRVLEELAAKNKTNTDEAVAKIVALAVDQLTVAITPVNTRARRAAMEAMIRGHEVE